MQPIRQVIEDMPALFSVPPEVQHQRVEIIIWPLGPLSAQGAFKKALAAMPNVGNDEDFGRQHDLGRGDIKWDS